MKHSETCQPTPHTRANFPDCICPCHEDGSDEIAMNTLFVNVDEGVSVGDVFGQLPPEPVE